MLDAGFVNVQQYADGGWLTGLKYADEIETMLEKETDSEEGKLKKVGFMPRIFKSEPFVPPQSLRANSEIRNARLCMVDLWNAEHRSYLFNLMLFCMSY